jgi:hypothetical protein
MWPYDGHYGRDRSLVNSSDFDIFTKPLAHLVGGTLFSVIFMW